MSNHSYDLVVLGAGAAGLATALFAALRGLRPVLIEKSSFVGGTTALSAGSVWIPNTEAGRKVNPSDNFEAALSYLQAVTPAHALPMQQTFLELGPKAVNVLERHSHVRFRAYTYHPDYFSDANGASLQGRVLEPVPFDAGRLGHDIEMIRPPIPEFTLFGGMMVDRTDIRHLLNATKSWASLSHGIGLLQRHACDRLRGRRSSRLVMGNALIGRLLASVIDRKVAILRETEPTQLILSNGRVTGVRVTTKAGEETLTARAGVVLAGGGFNRNPQLRRSLIPTAEIYTPIAAGSTGDLVQLALSVGAKLGPEGGGHAFWAPVSVHTRGDGSKAVFPHFVLDRAKPGTLVVNQAGRRFLNESTSYNLFALTMIEAHAREPSIPAFLVCDSRALLAYGLGMVRPGGWSLRRLIAEGYVVNAPSLAALGDKLSIDPLALEESVARMNRFADTGFDEDFRRGTTAYERNLGDPAFSPNPTLGRLEKPPFYAIRLYPGDIASSTGLVTGSNARVLGSSGPIKGLFAVGNDMQSVMGGAYPGPGITLEPALAFAYAAAESAAAELRDGERGPL